MKKVIAAAGIGAALIAGPLLGAGTANATDGYDSVSIHHVRVTANWTGSTCLFWWGPGTDNTNGLGSRTQCSYNRGFEWDYSAAPGEWVGVDRQMGNNSSVMCSLYVDGRRIAFDYAQAGDGHEASCLERL